MKIRVGTLRRLIREAAGAAVQPGKYYILSDVKWKSPGVAKVTKVGPDPRHPGMVFVTFQERAGSVSTQRLEAFQERIQGEASPEEAQEAEAAWAGESAHMARSIDTSREGT